jgi:hypothetical protein
MIKRSKISNCLPTDAKTDIMLSSFGSPSKNNAISLHGIKQKPMQKIWNIKNGENSNKTAALGFKNSHLLLLNNLRK